MLIIALYIFNYFKNIIMQQICFFMITNKKNKKISFVFQLTQKIYRVTKATYLIKVMRYFLFK